MTVNEYRKKHKRCRTCKYANIGSRNFLHDYCEAKNIQFEEPISSTFLRGCFCKLYEPKEYKNG